MDLYDEYRYRFATEYIISEGRPTLIVGAIDDWMKWYRKKGWHNIKYIKYIYIYIYIYIKATGN